MTPALHQFIRIAVTCLAIALLGGCQTHTTMDARFAALADNVDAPRVLVTFAQSQSDRWLPGGSSRAYHSGSAWTVPLTLRRKISQLEQQLALKEALTWPIDALDVHCVVFTLNSEDNLQQILRRIRQHDDVLNAQAVNEFTLMARDDSATPVAYNDPQFALQYGAQRKAIQQLHEVTRGRDIKVGIVDTAVDEAHPDLQGQIATHHRYVGANEVMTHGTAMAGIIAAKADNRTGLVGVAPEAQLHIYGACNGHDGGRCNSINLLRAIEQAIDDGVDILNLSLAGPHDTLLEQLLNVAQSRRMLLIAASDVEPAEHNFPATMPGVIAVRGLLDQAPRRPTLAPAQFSDWLLRREKLSTRAGGGYRFFYGSSVAAASVSGLAALLRSDDDSVDIRPLLQRLAQEHCVPQHLPAASAAAYLVQAASRCKPATSLSQTATSDLDGS